MRFFDRVCLWLAASLGFVLGAGCYFLQHFGASAGAVMLGCAMLVASLESDDLRVRIALCFGGLALFVASYGALPCVRQQRSAGADDEEGGPPSC